MMLKPARLTSQGGLAPAEGRVQSLPGRRRDARPMPRRELFQSSLPVLEEVIGDVQDLDLMSWHPGAVPRRERCPFAEVSTGDLWWPSPRQEAVRVPQMILAFEVRVPCPK